MATAEFSKLAGILSTALSQNHFLGFETAPLELMKAKEVAYEREIKLHQQKFRRSRKRAGLQGSRSSAHGRVTVHYLTG